jgi:hypothetical protein
MSQDSPIGQWCGGVVWPNLSRMPCSHEGFHSGEGRYEAATRTLRYVLVCDECHAEIRELLVQSYVPDYRADGNAPHITG